MKLRQHRGGLAESLETAVEIAPTMNALLAEIRTKMAPWGIDVPAEGLRVEPYGGVDERIGWDTHIVIIEGYGPYGFTDGPLRKTPNVEVSGGRRKPMSKQSEAKAAQHYMANSACCKHCKNYRSEVIEHPAAFSWSRTYTTEKKRRCDIGGFSVQATGHCAFFAWDDV